MGIREQILEKTYRQCLKLLNPRSREFKRKFPKADTRYPLTDKEKRALGASGGLLQYVQMGSFPLEAYTKLTRLPAIYIANGADSEDVSSSNPRVGSSDLEGVLEVFMLTLRLVTHQEVEPKYEDSNPVVVATIQEQLDYFLDMQSFGGITDKRFGYRIPSRVKSAILIPGQTLKGIASPWEIADFDFEVVFQRQYARD